MGCSTSKDADPQLPNIEHSFYMKYKLGKKLGEGAFGQVRACTDRSTGETLAVKIVDVREYDENGQGTGNVNKNRDRVTRAEILLWTKVCSANSVHVVELRRNFSEKSLYYMVCEQCDCSFMDRLVQDDCMTEADLAKTFKQMFLGIAHTHACGIVHRDVKPDNFLWGGPKKDVLKLCDFGLAVAMPTDGKMLKGVFGTAPYMAPELLKGGYEFRVDVWSVGVIAYLLIFGCFPYSPTEATAAAMKTAILNDSPRLDFEAAGKGPEGVVSGSIENAMEFAKGLLHRDFKERKTAAEVLNLAFMSEEPKTVQKTLAVTDGLEMRKRRERARTLTKQLKKKPSPTVQRGINDLLKMLVVKNVGEEGANFFSEGDRDRDMDDQEVQKAVSLADTRITKVNSRRDVRHSTHSGVVANSRSLPDVRDLASYSTAKPARRQPETLGRGVVSLGEVSPTFPTRTRADTEPPLDIDSSPTDTAVPVEHKTVVKKGLL